MIGDIILVWLFWEAATLLMSDIKTDDEYLRPPLSVSNALARWRWG